MRIAKSAITTSQSKRMNQPYSYAASLTYKFIGSQTPDHGRVLSLKKRDFLLLTKGVRIARSDEENLQGSAAITFDTPSVLAYRINKLGEIGPFRQLKQAT
ncbi:MAG: hypothetical protein KME03_02885 [Aphanocapsa lilacina HA4352-LM1]|jgi:hypothetical protein|nr:hypothetical protein [Aphanocapsa lilacina HA4352-LM1]